MNFDMQNDNLGWDTGSPFDLGRNSGLATPSILWTTVQSGGVFAQPMVMWYPIPGATSYDVSVNDVITNQAQTNFPYNRFTQPGVQRVQVRARNGGMVSNWSNVVRPTINLLAPRATISGTTLSWQPVVGAMTYEVCINGYMYPAQTNTAFNLSNLPAGVHTISVRALTSALPRLVSPWSQQVGLTIGSESLTTPVIALFESTVGSHTISLGADILWNVVRGAVRYDVSINGNIISQEPASYNLSSLPAGTHSIKVRASNGQTTTDWSNTITYTAAQPNAGLPAPILNIGGSVMSWNAVPGATIYEVQVNGTLYLVSGTSFSLSVPSGPYSLRVRASNNFNATSDWSNVFNLFLQSTVTPVAVSPMDPTPIEDSIQPPIVEPGPAPVGGLTFRVTGEGSTRQNITITNRTGNNIGNLSQLRLAYSGNAPTAEWPATWAVGSGGILTTTINGALNNNGSIVIPMGVGTNTRIASLTVNGNTANREF